MDTLKRIALTLTIIGAVNWGLIGLFQFDLVAAIFGGQDGGFSRLIYTLVGLSGLVCISIFADIMDDQTEDSPIQSSNVSYGTEFGKEEDFTPLDDDDDGPRQI